MAGVGFELKRIFRDNNSILNALKGYSVTAVVTEGPMILVIALLWLQRFLMGLFGASYRDKEVFLFLMTYVMIFSLILSNLLLMLVNRFISDCIYQERIEDILPAYFGTLFFLLLLGGPLALVYLLTLPVSVSVRAASFLLFCSMLVIWVQMAFLSAVKRYEYELMGFLLGTAVALGGALGLMRLGVLPLEGALWGTALGFSVMLILYSIQLLTHYPMGRFNLFVMLPELGRYKSLLLIGLCMGLGLYTHNFVFWASEYKNQIFPTGVFCTRYDVPVFFATLTILPMLVQFVVSLETRFSVKNRAYFDTILYGGRLEDIRAAHTSMENALYSELGHMVEVQLIFTVLAVTFLGNYLQTVGLDETTAGTYRVLCFGYLAYGLMKCCTVILLYFDDRKGACVGSMLFLALSTGFSIVTLKLGVWSWGAGFLCAGILTAVVLLVRIRQYLDRLEYHVFCKQPLFTQEENGVLKRMNAYFVRKDQEFEQRRRREREQTE